MVRCLHPDCGWRAIAPSRTAAYEQYLAHVVDAHADVVEESPPDDMVQVKIGQDGEWRTVTMAEAKRLHARYHEDGEDHVPPT